MTSLRRVLDQRLDALRGEGSTQPKGKKYGGTSVSQISKSLQKSGILTKTGKVRTLTESS